MRYGATLIAVAVVYFALAKAGLALASLHPSATPIWPPTGLAIACVILWGYRVWPAIFLGAFLANATTAGSLFTFAAIALGNTGEAILAGYLVARFAGGRNAFETPAAIARFALVSLVATMVSATVGVASLTTAGFAPIAAFASIWTTWWLGDVAGALVVTPVVVLWVNEGSGGNARGEWLESLGVLFAAVAVGLIAFSPLIAQTANRAALGFLAVVPLLWAALRRGPRDTATAALVLSGFAIWGTLAGGGPFFQATLNDSFLLLLMFMISMTVPSLALSADVSVRRQVQQHLQTSQDELDERVQARTRTLAETNAALLVEIEHRKRAEEEVRQQRVHLEEAQRLADLGSWMWDIEEGRVTWSDQLYQIYGVRRGDFAGTLDDFVRRIHEDDRATVREEVARALQSGQGFRIKERIMRPSGEMRYLQSCGEVVKDDNGKPIKMLGICQDVTERTKAENALRDSEEQHRLLVKSVTDYAIFMLDARGAVVSWNAGAERIKQYSAEEIIGRHFSTFYTPEDRARDEPDRALKAAAQHGRYEAEGWRMRKDGTRLWSTVVLDAIHDDDGRLIGFAKITRDITERREAQIELEKTREQLAQSQKLEAIGQLTGGIAHDFNNLLMIVSGNAQILRRRLTDPQVLRSVDAIHAAAGRGESLTRQLLAFSRRQKLNPVVIDLGERLSNMREMLHSSLRGDIDLIIDVAPDAWLVEADVAELELAILNVAVNARDAMPEGGSFTISIRNTRLAPTAAVHPLEGDFVALSMTDTGSGISPEHMSKVFDPFFTTKPVGKGTGLGLSQVHGFALQSGGAAHIASEIGQGTTITIYIPRNHSSQPTPTKTARLEPERPGEGRILLVEDDIEVARTTSSLLEDLGYDVVHEENATDALARLEHDDVITLVLSDIMMPGGMDGLALAREVSGRYPDIPVLLTSGYSEALLVAELQFPVLRKPYQISALDKAVRAAVESRAASVNA